MIRHRKAGRGRRWVPALLLVRAAVVALALGLIVLALLTDGFVSHRSSEPPSASRTIAVVATDALNVRDGASLDALVIDTLPLGSELEVLGVARNGFTPVRHGSGRAWMATAFLLVPGSSPTILPAVSSEDPDEPGERSTLELHPPEEPPAVTVQKPSPVEADDAFSTEPAIPDLPVEDAAGFKRWIDVDRSTGIVTLFEGQDAVATYQGKIGKDPSVDGFYSTAIGTFHVYSMNRELTETPFAAGVYLTDWVGFDPERSNGFHSPVRDEWGNLQPVQNPTTLGCVRLDADAAVAVFEFSSIGMRVEIHD